MLYELFPMVGFVVDKNGKKLIFASRTHGAAGAVFAPPKIDFKFLSSQFAIAQPFAGLAHNQPGTGNLSRCLARSGCT